MAVSRYDEACVEETKGLLGGLFKYCKKKFTVDQVRFCRCGSLSRVVSKSLEK
jgi:hypothetical protein